MTGQRGWRISRLNYLNLLPAVRSLVVRLRLFLCEQEHEIKAPKTWNGESIVPILSIDDTYGTFRGGSDGRREFLRARVRVVATARMRAAVFLHGVPILVPTFLGS